MAPSERDDRERGPPLKREPYPNRDHRLGTDSVQPVLRADPTRISDYRADPTAFRKSAPHADPTRIPCSSASALRLVRIGPARGPDADRLRPQPSVGRPWSGGRLGRGHAQPHHLRSSPTVGMSSPTVGGSSPGGGKRAPAMSRRPTRAACCAGGDTTRASSGRRAPRKAPPAVRPSARRDSTSPPTATASRPC